ncbi:MAG: Fic family protein [Treponema sp.]|nr:Fic family protein [Treponema sp.]
MEIIYPDLQQALAIHARTIEVSGGGLLGYRDIAQLESVLAHIRNDVYYPTLVDKLTHLFFCSNKFHCFLDGNKRIAISLSADMLLKNGYVFRVPSFIAEMENISYHVAAGRIDKELLHDVIEAVIHDEYDMNEALKLRVFLAISTDEP